MIHLVPDGDAAVDLHPAPGPQPGADRLWLLPDPPGATGPLLMLPDGPGLEEPVSRYRRT